MTTLTGVKVSSHSMTSREKDTQSELKTPPVTTPDNGRLIPVDKAAPEGTLELSGVEAPLTLRDAMKSSPGRTRRVTYRDPVFGPGGVVYQLFKAAADGDLETTERFLGRSMTDEERDLGRFIFSTEERRLIVSCLVTCEVPKAQLALVLGVSRPTIYKDLAAIEKALATEVFQDRPEVWPFIDLIQHADALRSRALVHNQIALAWRITVDTFNICRKLGIVTPSRVQEAIARAGGLEAAEAKASGLSSEDLELAEIADTLEPQERTP